MLARVGDILRAGARVALVASDSSRRDGLVEAVGALGPTYAKFGQALSSRGDIVGDDLARALRGLCDDMPAFSDERAAEIVREDLGAEGEAVAEAVRAAGAPRRGGFVGAGVQGDVRRGDGGDKGAATRN